MPRGTPTSSFLTRPSASRISPPERPRRLNACPKNTPLSSPAPRWRKTPRTCTPLSSSWTPICFTPLWRFAADHFNIPRGQKVRDRQTRVAGYKNLDLLKEKLVGHPYPPDLGGSGGSASGAGWKATTMWIWGRNRPKSIRSAPGSLAERVRKHPLAPMDLRGIQAQVLRMRMVCNSTFLVDRETQVSPKLRELSSDHRRGGGRKPAQNSDHQ